MPHFNGKKGKSSTRKIQKHFPESNELFEEKKGAEERVRALQARDEIDKYIQNLNFFEWVNEVENLKVELKKCREILAERHKNKENISLFQEKKKTSTYLSDMPTRIAINTGIAESTKRLTELEQEQKRLLVLGNYKKAEAMNHFRPDRVQEIEYLLESYKQLQNEEKTLLLAMNEFIVSTATEENENFNVITAKDEGERKLEQLEEIGSRLENMSKTLYGFSYPKQYSSAALQAGLAAVLENHLNKQRWKEASKVVHAKGVLSLLLLNLWELDANTKIALVGLGILVVGAVVFNPATFPLVLGAGVGVLAVSVLVEAWKWYARAKEVKKENEKYTHVIEIKNAKGDKKPSQKVYDMSDLWAACKKGKIQENQFSVQDLHQTISGPGLGA